MKLKVKDVRLSTGGPLIAILSIADARKLDLHALDRVKIDSIVATVNVTEKAVKPGEIGLFEEVFRKTRIRSGQLVDVDAAARPQSVYHIKKKLRGFRLSDKEIKEITNDIIRNNLSEIELTYFVSACYTFGLDLTEVLALTKAIAKSGKKLKLGKKLIVDKHSIGGVPGNRTSMLVVPIVAAAGLCIPKTSSRAITSASGTADSMEVLAPVSHSVKAVEEIVKKTNGCIVWGGALELASADDALIKIEYPLELDPEGILLASIMAKKVAATSTHVLIDIPYGKTTKITFRKNANDLREKFILLGKRLGIKTWVALTNGELAIGRGIGPALEARDIMWILQRDSRRPLDLEYKAIELTSILFEMTGLKAGRKLAVDILNSGKAFEKMQEIIKAQGGKIKTADSIKLGKYVYDVKAKKDCAVRLDNTTITRVARALGAPEDKGAGIYLHIKYGARAKRGEKIATLYAESRKRLEYGVVMLKRLVVCSY